IASGGDALDNRDELLEPCMLYLLANRVTEVGGRRPVPRREDEGERTVVAHVLDEGDGLGEVVVGLAGESDEGVGAEREIGDRGAQPVDEREISLAIVRSPHRLQDPGGPRLGREMHVLADARTVLHRLDNRLAEVLGVRAREADPLDARYGVARAQEPAE